MRRAAEVPLPRPGAPGAEGPAVLLLADGSQPPSEEELLVLGLAVAEVFAGTPAPEEEAGRRWRFSGRWWWRPGPGPAK